MDEQRLNRIRERHARQLETGLCECGNELEDPANDDHCLECD